MGQMGSLTNQKNHPSPSSYSCSVSFSPATVASLHSGSGVQMSIRLHRHHRPIHLMPTFPPFPHALPQSMSVGMS